MTWYYYMLVNAPCQKLAHLPKKKCCISFSTQHCCQQIADASHRLDPEAGDDALLPVSVEQAALEGQPGPKVDIVVNPDVDKYF